MKKCTSCNNKFKRFAVIDGKKRDFRNRTRCLECSPWNGISGPTPDDKNKKSLLRAHLKYYYDITLDDFESMNDDCQGLCMICRQAPSGRISRLCVDHDHQDGRIRGLLCHSCNMRLGWFEKNIDSILEYLGIEHGQTTH